MEINQIQNLINEQGAIINTNKTYLDKTDYKAIKAFEKKEELSTEFLTERQAARAAINEALEQIELLTTQLELVILEGNSIKEE